MAAKFYDEAIVSEPGSVVLRKWNAERAVQKAVLRKAQSAQRAYGGAAMNRLTGDWNANNT
jgi:hypothetical protein